MTIENMTTNERHKLENLQNELGKRCSYYLHKLRFADTMTGELLNLGLAKCTSSIEKGSELEVHIPRVQLDQNEILLSNFSDIYRFHYLEGRMNFEADFPDAVQDIITFEDTIRHMYVIYKQNHAAQQSLLSMMEKNDKHAFFQQVQKKYRQPFSLDSMFISSPLKILNIYQASLKGILRHVDDHSIWKDTIEEAMNILLSILSEMEITPSVPWLWELDLDSIIGDHINLVEHSKIKLMSVFNVSSDSDRKGLWNKFKRRIFPHKRHILLYENCIVIGKNYSQDGIRSTVPLVKCIDFFENDRTAVTDNIQAPNTFDLIDDDGYRITIYGGKKGEKDVWLTVLEENLTGAKRTRQENAVLTESNDEVEGSPV